MDRILELETGVQSVVVGTIYKNMKVAGAAHADAARLAAMASHKLGAAAISVRFALSGQRACITNVPLGRVNAPLLLLLLLLLLLRSCVLVARSPAPYSPLHDPQLKPNILDEINADTTNAASNPPIDGLKSARYVSDTDTAVLEDEVRRLGSSAAQGAHETASRAACRALHGWRGQCYPGAANLVLLTWHC